MKTGRREQDDDDAPQRGALPYDPEEWNRRLAEARARRQAALEERGVARHRQASAGRPASTPEVLPPNVRPLAVAQTVREARKQEPAEAPTADVSPRRAGRALSGPVPMLLLGCAFGAGLTALIAAALVTWQQPDTEPQLVAALSGTSVAKPPQADEPTVAAQPDAPQPEEARTAIALVEPPQPRPIAAGVAITRSAIETPQATPAAAPAVEVAQPDAASAMPIVGTPRPRPSAMPPTGGNLLEETTPVPAAELMPPAASSATSDVPFWAEDLVTTLEPPPDAPPRSQLVAVIAPRSVPGEARREAVELLRAAGWQAEEPRGSPFTVRETHIRYYHAGDRPAAEDLAAQFSARARDFTNLRPAPPAGRVELWLAGHEPARAPVRNRSGSNPIVRTLERIDAALQRFE